MKGLLEKGYLDLNLPSYETGRTEKLRAAGLSSDIAQTHFKKGVEFLGTASCVYCAESTLGGDEPWILI